MVIGAQVFGTMRQLDGYTAFSQVGGDGAHLSSPSFICIVTWVSTGIRALRRRSRFIKARTARKLVLARSGESG